MSFTIAPGQTKTLKIVFTDSAVPPVQHPLRDVPTAVETTAFGTVIAPVGVQAPADADFSWTVACPAGVAVGSAISIDVNGINPDGVADLKTYEVDVIAVDDNTQQATFV